MRESALRSKFMKLLKDSGFFAQAIESSTNPGMPDTYLIYQGAATWIECKLLKDLPKRAETSLFKSLNHPLSNEQRNWITICIAHGGNCAILVGYDRKYYLVPGVYADTFNELTWDKLQRFLVTREDLIIILRLGNAKQLRDTDRG